MTEPRMNAENWGPYQKKQAFQFGYEISQSDESTKHAVEKAFKLAQEVKKAGQDVRTWADKTVDEIRDIIQKYLLDNHRKDRKPSPVEETEKKIWEIAYWENEISRMIRVYFRDISNSMTELKKLNPPLTSSQLDPFLKAMLADRRFTLSKLEPLTTIIDQIIQIKSKLCLASPAASYRTADRKI